MMSKYRAFLIVFGVVLFSFFIWLGFGSSYSLTSLIQEAYSADDTGDHQDPDSQKKKVTGTDPPHEDDGEEHAASGADDQHAAGTTQPHDEGADDHHAAGTTQPHDEGADDQHAAGTTQAHDEGADDQHAAGTAQPHDEGADDQHAAGTEDHQTVDTSARVSGKGAILFPKKAITLVSPAQLSGYRSYQVYCVACHGNRGNGDGFNAKNLSTPPAKHSDASYMVTLSDKDIRQIIKGGGVSQGRSPLMPPWGGVLSDKEISNLLAFIRILPEDRLVANAEMNMGVQAGGHHGAAMGSGDHQGPEADDHPTAEPDEHKSQGPDDHHGEGPEKH